MFWRQTKYLSVRLVFFLCKNMFEIATECYFMTCLSEQNTIVEKY